MMEPRPTGKSLPENEEQFRAFMDSSPIFAWAKDEQGRYQYVNRTYERSFGSRMDNWRGKTDFEIWSEESAELFRRNDRQVLEQQRVINDVETATLADGGQSFLVCKFPFIDAAGNRLVGGIGVDISEQKRLQFELRQSQQRFQTLSDLALEGVIIHTSMRILDANSAALRLFGYDLDEFLGCPPARLVVPEASGLFHEARQNPYESLAVRKNGSRFPVEITSRMMEPMDGSQWVTVVRDLTERRRAERELRDSEERMRLAQEAASIGYFDWNLLTDETIWSESLQRLLGQAIEPHKSLFEKVRGVHPDDRPAFQAQLENALAGKTSKVSISYRSTAPDGTACWRICEARVHTDDSGRPSRMIGVIADITPHKKAEETQRIEEERKHLESVILSLTEAVVILNPEGGVLSMNPAALRMYEFDEGDGILQTLPEFVATFEATYLDGTLVPPAEWPVSRVMRGEAVAGVELRVLNRRTGHVRMTSYGGAPVFDDKGAIVMLVLSIRDITAERLASEEIKRANAALHSLSGQLLRLQDLERKRIARELHDGTLQVITAMSMNLLTLARSPNIVGDAETLQLITEAQELARRASRELRTMSYLLHPPDLDELGLVAALRSWADGFAHRAGIELDIALDDPGRLDPDSETALFRIAQESLANVQRHSGSSKAELRLLVSDQEVRLEVRDEGCGLSPDILTPSSARIGVGILGMRERARQLGGTLQIFCDGIGTTVVACFPVRKL